MEPISQLTIAIGIGLVVSVLFSEAFLLTTGGLVSLGYLALALNSPVTLMVLLLASILTYAVYEGASRYVLIYGRRTVVYVILIGYLSGLLFKLVYAFLVGYAITSQHSLSAVLTLESLSTFGFIVPGLIALGYIRQGVLPTLTALFICATIVRLLMILFGLFEYVDPGLNIMINESLLNGGLS